MFIVLPVLLYFLFFKIYSNIKLDAKYVFFIFFVGLYFVKYNVVVVARQQEITDLEFTPILLSVKVYMLL